MDENSNPRRICRTCRTVNDSDTEKCVNCGAELPAVQQFADDNPQLLYVDAENRVEVGRFGRENNADLACGMLRANGIACELGPLTIPGVPGEIVLWTNREDVELARALLADAERPAEENNDAA